MNISSTTSASEQRTAGKLAPKARFDKTLFATDDEKKMEHTGFRGASFLDSMWESMRSLPKSQQVNLATSILALQLSQNGINDQNRDFIKRFKSRFSPSEMGTIKNLLRAQPAAQVSSVPQVEKWMKELDELWSDDSERKAEKKKSPAIKNPYFQTPDAIFFQTTMNKARVREAGVQKFEM